MTSSKKTKRSRAPSNPKTTVEGHLFADHLRSIRMGLYWRLPEFKEKSIELTDEQCERLQRCLGKPLSGGTRLSIAVMIRRLIEHELVVVRAPAREAVLKELDKIQNRAIYCMTELDAFSSYFNINAQVVEPVRFSMKNVGSSSETVMTAEQAAIDLVGGAIRQPIPSAAAVWDLVEVCRELKKRHSRKQRGNEARPYFTFFLLCLLHAAKNSGAKTTLPRKDAFGSNGSQRPTNFLNFVFEAIAVMHEMAPHLLNQPTITSQERDETLATIAAEYRKLAKSQILLRLTKVRDAKVPGLSAFVAAATAGPAETVHSGSTRGRCRTKGLKKIPSKSLI